jgi:hypothetical protein
MVSVCGAATTAAIIRTRCAITTVIATTATPIAPHPHPYPHPAATGRPYAFVRIHIHAHAHRSSLRAGLEVA